MNKPNKIIIEINEKISRAISKYAKEQGITYEEAVKRSCLIVDDIKMEPMSSDVYSLSVPGKVEKVE